MVLQLVQKHAERHPEHPSGDRLRQLDLSACGYSRLRRCRHARTVRESVIPQSDVAATVQFIVQHPDVGAQRAHLTLIDQEQALVGTVFINDARQEVARQAEEQYRARREQQKLLEAELRTRQMQQPQYKHIQAHYPHHIWAIDFLAVRFLGFRLVVCALYDIYSQHYLALEAGTGCHQTLAQHTIEVGVANARTRAARILRRDNGKAFLVQSFQNSLAENGIQDRPIPPGQPWYNGSLEANNGSLRTAIATAAMQEMPDEPARFRSARNDIRNALRLLQQTCDHVRTKLNEHICRPKFAMPPAQVLHGRVDCTRERHERFVKRKKQERRLRMERLQKTPDRSDQHKTFIEKVRHAFRQVAHSMTTDRLYVLNEAIHRRYQAVEV